MPVQTRIVELTSRQPFICTRKQPHDYVIISHTAFYSWKRCDVILRIGEEAMTIAGRRNCVDSDDGAIVHVNMKVHADFKIFFHKPHDRVVEVAISERTFKEPF